MASLCRHLRHVWIRRYLGVLICCESENKPPIFRADTPISKSYLRQARRRPISPASGRTRSEYLIGFIQEEANMIKTTSLLTAIAGLALVGSSLALTQPAAAANGCGPAQYRGPGGACHRFGYGPYPGGYNGPYRNAYRWNGCPPGYWRGPWGHCRNTPYHGRLPDGSWK
jgi:hypothetical protein